MKQHYFVVVLAHSLHGRLRRIHIPHQALYVVLGLALLGGFSLFGMVSSYLRMTWKVSNYNSLRREIEVLRSRYRELQKVTNQKNEQLATLEVFASEVSVAYGLNRKPAGTLEVVSEARLTPNYRESLNEYNLLRNASISRMIVVH